jgi:hypothetical protein
MARPCFERGMGAGHTNGQLYLHKLSHVESFFIGQNQLRDLFLRGADTAGKPIFGTPCSFTICGVFPANQRVCVYPLLQVLLRLAPPHMCWRG